MGAPRFQPGFFDFLPGSAVRVRLLRFSNEFTAYSNAIELNLGKMILDINLHNRYEQDFSGPGEGLIIQNFLRTSFVHVSLSRRRNNLSPRFERRPQRPFGPIFREQ